MERHVIVNMGAELGATTSVFPSDAQTRRFLRAEGREADWTQLRADAGARYDIDEELDLSALEPLIAKPTSPGNVAPVREVAGLDIYQAYIDATEYDAIEQGDLLTFEDIREGIQRGGELEVENKSKQARFRVRHALSPRQIDIILAGGQINQIRERLVRP